VRQAPGSPEPAGHFQETLLPGPGQARECAAEKRQAIRARLALKPLLKILQRSLQAGGPSAGLGLLVAEHAPPRTSRKRQEKRDEPVARPWMGLEGEMEGPDCCHMRQKEKKTSCYA
jgi:hypothetical protein